MQLYIYKLISGFKQALLVSLKEIDLEQAARGVLRTMPNHKLQEPSWFMHLANDLCDDTNAVRFSCQECLDVTEMWQEETARREECK